MDSDQSSDHSATGNRVADQHSRDSVSSPSGEAETHWTSDDEWGEPTEADGDEEPEGIADLLPFTLEERDLLEKLGAIVRRRMRNAQPATLKGIAAFLYALEHLPYALPEVSLDLALVERSDSFTSYVSVEIDHGAFRLTTGGSEESAEYGSDSFSELLFEIEAGGFRDGRTDSFVGWLEQFSSGTGELEVQGDDDLDMEESGLDDGWARLETYWACHEDDVDNW